MSIELYNLYLRLFLEDVWNDNLSKIRRVPETWKFYSELRKVEESLGIGPSGTFRVKRKEYNKALTDFKNLPLKKALEE
jgi:hypothetical protein